MATRKRSQAIPPASPLSVDERRAQGRALRDAVPRSAHADWAPPSGRHDPVELLQASNEGRMPLLVPIRFGRMSASPFAFYRGAAALMAADLAHTPTTGVRVQACGDAHLMNFGGFATPERHVIFDINDLDETLPAPWEWDLKRLAASVVIAAQFLRLSETEAARAARDMAREYRERMADYAAMRVLDVWYDRIDLQRYQDRSADPEVMDEVRKRMAERIAEAQRKNVPDHLYPKLVELQGEAHRIKDEPPLIFHPDETLAPDVHNGFAGAIAGYRESLPEHVRTLFDRFHFRDLAVKVVGVGSVGTLCAVALLFAAEDDPLFLQVKEARDSVLAPYVDSKSFASNGERVVFGQRLMQAASDVFLGHMVSPMGQHMYVRQLRDVKVKPMIEIFNPQNMLGFARSTGWALARAHARSGDPAVIAGYIGKGEVLADAIAEFAVAYADCNERDHAALVAAVRAGRLDAETEGD